MTNPAEKVRSIFGERFQQEPLLVRSPGRINIIGEHTDYNEGFVLPAAIDKAAYLAVSLRDDDEIHLVAADLQEQYTTSLRELAPCDSINWPNYILGAAAQFRSSGLPLRGFNAVLSSDVPIGAGLSSSAAVECATVFALNHLLGTGLNRLTMVKMAQMAEHEFAGVKCGIMDQFASMMGKKDQLIKIDCRSLDYEYIPLKLDGYKVLLLNTNVKHSLAGSEYNLRRQECEAAVQLIRQHHPEVTSLRFATEAMLDAYVQPVNPMADQRSRYVVQEIMRLLDACDALKHGDVHKLGRLMFETHEGLSKMYSVSCKELDWLVNQVRRHEAVLGARMMGGGFGGCTINLVREEAIDDLVSTLAPAYEAAMDLPLTYYVASIDNGTEIIS
ncbi:MAG: galactokinase [Chitinophagaceae bacterium]|jgi:galactokinase|nr:galactokinase [Chitinophagaceae bacterium]